MLFKILTFNLLIQNIELFSPLFYYDIKINDKFYVTDNKFLGITIDAEIMRYSNHQYILSNKRFINLAKNLGPSYLRMGGTAADMVNYIGHGKTEVYSNTVEKYFETANEMFNSPDDSTSIKLNRELWDKINYFVTSLGSKWDFIYGLNAMIRDKTNRWDSVNAKKLLNYSHRQNYFFHTELGNEPTEFFDVFGNWITPQQLAHDFYSLKKLLRGYKSHKNRIMIGPDIDRVNNTLEKQTYLIQFLDELATIQANYSEPIVDKISWHSYYIRGKGAQLSQYLDPNILDTLVPKIESINQVVRKSRLPHLDVWLGEGSNAWGSGTPNMSDRYVAGFMFLDKIGQCASRGVKVFIRQSLYYENYALIGHDLKPNPDYWIAVLYNRLVGPRVLPVQALGVFKPPDKKYTTLPSNSVRVYAHCAKHIPGGIVFYVMNLNDHEVMIKFDSLPFPKTNWGGLKSSTRKRVLPDHDYTLTENKGMYFGNTQLQYLLMPGPCHHIKNHNISFSSTNQNYLTNNQTNYKNDSLLLSRDVCLNRNINLKVNPNGEIPCGLLTPKNITINHHSNVNIDISLPGYTFGFFVYPRANFSYCK